MSPPAITRGVVESRRLAASGRAALTMVVRSIVMVTVMRELRVVRGAICMVGERRRSGDGLVLWEKVECHGSVRHSNEL